MPFYPPFNMPFFYNNYMHPRNSSNAINSSANNGSTNFSKVKDLNYRADSNYKTSYQNQNASSYNQVQRQKASENYYDSNLKVSENNYESRQKKSENYYGAKQEASENIENSEASEAFFEIFGLKLYFDDILIMCILFFLYTEKVHDDELFICLILLLLT